jgi:hypothetical protein
VPGGGAADRLSIVDGASVDAEPVCPPADFVAPSRCRSTGIEMRTWVPDPGVLVRSIRPPSQRA